MKTRGSLFGLLVKPRIRKQWLLSTGAESQKDTNSAAADSGKNNAGVLRWS